MRAVILGGPSALRRGTLVHVLGTGARVVALCGERPAGESTGWITAQGQPTCPGCRRRWEILQLVTAAGTRGYRAAQQGQIYTLRALFAAGYLRRAQRAGHYYYRSAA